jgi:hypothetical protein
MILHLIVTSIVRHNTFKSFFVFVFVLFEAVQGGSVVGTTRAEKVPQTRDYGARLL